MDTIIESIRSTLFGLIDGIISFVPKLLTGIVILLVGWLIARALRYLVIQVARRVGVDRVIESAGLTGGLQRVNIKQTPSELIAAILYWLVFLNFLLSALQQMNLGSAVEPLQRFIDLLPNIVAALLTFTLGVLLAQFIGRTVSGALSGVGLEIHELLGNVTRVLLICIVFIISLQQIGMDVDLLTQIFTSTLTIIVAGIALAFGLGGRSVTRNVLAGYYARELFQPGDRLSIDGQEGVLEGIGTLNAEIALTDGVLTIPNVTLTEGQVKKLDD